MTRTCKVGVHGRNADRFEDADYQVIREANLEAIKMMSLTNVDVFQRLRGENPNLEIITRLYHPGFNTGGHPSAEEFVNALNPVIAQLRPFCAAFQVHNEPNHVHRYEGWGSSDEDARHFNTWFLDVYGRLKQAHPWATFGFPGLAVPDPLHRDKAWLQICRPAIEQADWLGCHCYWQSPPNGGSVMMADHSGLCFKYYHEFYPNKLIHILECGNSNGQGQGFSTDEGLYGDEYQQWLNEVFKYPYIGSASFFILSSPDSNWNSFAWRINGSIKRRIVGGIGNMARPPLVPVQKANKTTGMVNSPEGLNLRSGPDTDQPILMLLPDQTTLEVMDEQGDWLFVATHEGNTGYVHRHYVVRADAAPQFAAAPQPVAQLPPQHAARPGVADMPPAALPQIIQPTPAMDERLYNLWLEHIKHGFENNNVMFKRVLRAFMAPYYMTIVMYVLLFMVGIGLFVMAAYLSTRENTQIAGLLFGGLGVATFLGYFLSKPLRSLEENLQFITWLGIVYNSYWTRLLYMQNASTVQGDLKEATAEAVMQIEQILNKNVEVAYRRPDVREGQQ